ncbi:hypothetical protein [uncultured Modestobacter sp.]|uniref:hypothetical protein n=1 Tax=uncultured Modestobacter sp. TaxID=380048 RepID=UPI0026209FA6|nr:hypothetical protein [uncultured Modestobacter sp.]
MRPLVPFSSSMPLAPRVPVPGRPARARRGGSVVAAAATALLLAGCAATSSAAEPTAAGGAAGQSSQVQPAPATVAPAPVEPVLPAVPPRFVAAGNEVEAELKTAAAHFVEDLGTYDPAAPSVRAAALPGPEQEIAASLGRADASSRVRVLFVQLGGLRPIAAPTYASAMVVAEQVRTGVDGAVRTEVRTLDVRLARGDHGWAVVELASAGGAPVDPPAELSGSAAAALAEPGLLLPDSARWDIAAGLAQDQMLDAAIAVARQVPIQISVLQTGHPYTVIDDRPAPPVSAHSSGRAFDIWAFDGVPVHDLTPEQVRELGELVLAVPGVTQVGMPTGLDLDGPGPRSFANAVHDDHLHVAVR